MDFTFLSAAGQTLFVRSDAESGHWVQHELSLTATFPRVAGKIIQRGQRVAFRDPATDSLEVYEIRQCVNREPDHAQEITAESIAVAELQDEHINSMSLTNVTAATALYTVLGATEWFRGGLTGGELKPVDISRGSVWQAIKTIEQNWNLYATPRVEISEAGVITGRFIDLAPAQGTFRGLRLSIQKNMLDSTVTYNDEDVYTALYGYGGSVEKSQSSGDDTTEELTFADVVWTATGGHPAKPAGQTYLEDPSKTALYGRGGRPRFGYYQNSAITDPAVLLQKTWETLQTVSAPKISISGTCEDLKRLGYNDAPIRLHDIAIIEIEETGELFSKEIIMLDVDLVDPSNTRPDIGDYIPNIIYINRNTEKHASGGGGGGGHGQTNAELEESDTFTMFEKTNDRIGMVVGTRNGGYYVKAGEIALAINKSGETGSYESTATISADHINISATSTVYTLAGAMHKDADGKLIIDNAGGIYVQRTVSGTTATFGVWDRGNLTGGVMVSSINGQSALKLKADVIDIDGLVSALAALSVKVNILEVTTVSTFGGLASFNAVSVDGHITSWQSQTVVTAVNRTAAYNFVDTGGTTRTIQGVNSVSTATLHYLGY